MDKASSNFVLFPKKASLVGQPLLTTLYYCCLYHYSLPSNAYASPFSLKEFFSINEREFFWIAVSALSRRKQFDEVEKLLTPKKSFVLSSKLVCPFQWSQFFLLLQKHQPPAELLKRWLKAVPNAEERYKICDQFGGEVAIEIQLDALLTLKDKRKLITLMGRLQPNSANFLKAQTLLTNTASLFLLFC
jgi:hypothetical protein